ncbi:MAG: ATP-binding protein [Dehalococcoidia bacterium]
MIIRRFERRAAEQALPEVLLTLAASLQGEESREGALDRLAGALTDRGVGYALLLEDGPDLRVERSTLSLAPDVWGRPLRLPRIAACLSRGRPLSYSDADEAFAEAPLNGERRRLLTGRSSGTLIAAPFRADADAGAVLCLASRDLSQRDIAAVWGLALQVGAALRRPTTPDQRRQPAGDDLSLFHELTRRLSYSLTGAEAIHATLEVLAPTLDFQLAASVLCSGDEDTTTVFSGPQPDATFAISAAAGALDAFIKLTGKKHDSCNRPAFQTATLSYAGSPSPATGAQSTLDAPLVIDGEVVGLVRIAAARPSAFGAIEERTFFTVANQVSLALERVAAQRQAERAQLASLAESLSDGIVLVDAALRVTSLNKAARDLSDALGAVQLAEGASLIDTALAALAEEALTTATQTSLRELPAAPSRDPAGRRYLAGMAAPLAGSREGSTAVVILRDVTEERLMQERLLQSEKMVSVGQLVSGVAHELNNPLTGIMGFAQLLLGREQDERTRQDVETILSEADRASKIVQNLLSFARRKRAEKEPADLNALLQRVLELRSYDLRVKNIDVELDLDSKLPETMVDTNQIQQVFLNLIVNAEQAMLAARDRGTLTVTSRKQKDTVRLSLRDDGPGMSPETLRRIFDPFFTTKEVGEGTGLGLTISYGIIEDHGGRIWAESAPDKGTSFIIELPIVRGESRRLAVEDPDDALPVDARSILVVDDEQSIQRLLGSILQMDGHVVDTARNGREALDFIAQRRYDVIITDIKMPDMNGRDLYQALLDLDQDLARRTIFITGDTVSPETRDFLQQVSNPCLAKPFRVREVRETISSILAESS